MADSTTGLDDAPARGMRPRQVVEFYLVLPLLVGLFLGAGRIGVYEFVTVGHHMVYMAVYGVVSWACYGAASKVMSIVLRPWSPPLMLVLLAGYIGGGFALLWPLRELLNSLFVTYLLPGSTFGPFWPPPADHLGSYIAISLQGIGWWLLAHWVDFRFRGVPRFGFAAPGRPEAALTAGPTPADPGANAATEVMGQVHSGGEPRLLARLPERLRDADILALEAEEHYTKVHTSRGNTLLLLRFSDAIAEMAPMPGLQVHRSFWISRRAVDRVTRVERRMFVRLQGGLEVPVSRSFRLAVQGAGLPGLLSTAGD